MNRVLRIDEEKPEMHISVQGYKVTLCFAEKENPEVAVLVKQALLSSLCNAPEIERLAEGLAFRRFDEGMVSKMAERVYYLYRGKDQESILMQKNACHDFAEKKGWNIVGEEQEIGVSGYKVSTDDLVKLKRIRKAAEQGEFDILLVFMYDRLGRNLNETPFIAEWFTKKGIHVWSVYEGEIIDGVDAERMLDYIRFWQTDEAQKL